MSGDGTIGADAHGDTVWVLFWHVHGGYADAFVRGDHEYLRRPEGTARA